MSDDICYVCDRPFEWQAPDSKGEIVPWRRMADRTPKGLRCAHREACRDAAESRQLTIFDTGATT